MPRCSMLLQVDDELVLAKHALTFWREQALLADTPLRHCVAMAVKFNEQHINRLVELREMLAGP